MKSRLSMRQNKIIHILRNSKTHITSEEISKALNVSSKTVRQDISNINDSLATQGICIDSVKGKGFILHADDQEALNRLYKDNWGLLGRVDRVFYLAIRLCTASGSVNYYDLEDEMAISSSTLSGDIAAFKTRFVNGVPFIKLNMAKNEIQLEDDERKRRFIMVKLLCDNWDYNSTGNVLFESDFIDAEVYNISHSVAGRILYEHGVNMDDYSLVFINLYLAVAYRRLQAGHVLNVSIPEISFPPEIPEACAEFFTVLGEKLDYHFPAVEILETVFMIYEIRLHHKDDFRARVLPEKYHAMAQQFIDRVYDVYGLDLNDDEDFKERLISFMSQLYRQMRDLVVRDTPENIKQHLFAEFNVALLIYQIAEKDFTLTEDELLYLSWAISGAFFNYFKNHPEARFNTVVISHMSVHSMWSLKNALIDQFGGYLNINEVIPVNQKDYYDFSGTELILSTIDIPIGGFSGRMLTVSPYLSREDSHNIVDLIRTMKIERLYPKKIITVSELLEDAFVHECMDFPEPYSLIDYMCQDFIEEDIFTLEQLARIQRRERITSFAVNPALTLLYSIIPGTRTKMSVMTLDHPLTWNKFKIRVIFMMSFAKEDANELFYLQSILFHRRYDPDILKNIKTIEELKDYYK